jgi:hypothetical protein
MRATLPCLRAIAGGVKEIAAEPDFSSWRPQEVAAEPDFSRLHS